MCGIAGFSNFKINYREEPGKWYPLLQKMNQVQKHRGPDEDGIFLSRHCGLSHVRLSIIDPIAGQQPMTCQAGSHKCTICFNGEIYNSPALRAELMRQGAVFQTASDTEVILMGFLLHGPEYVKELNGIFAFSIWDETRQLLYLFRDRLGVKPLFYTFLNNTLLFASEIKGILAYPGFSPVIDREGLCEIFGLGPAKTYGKGVFKNISELIPGHYLEFNGQTPKQQTYWKLISFPHEDTWQQTVEKTQFLLTDSVKLQMLSDVPICTFLSGGLDSSLVTSICSRELKRDGKKLDTYSFDFRDNAINFHANDFQPTQDRPWVDAMVSYADTRHHYLECSSEDLFANLFDAVNARDLPCMADVESSLLYFCRQVSAHHKVTLTGECADEIFGGYPWFHKKECFDADIFPWSMDMTPRTMLLRDEIAAILPIEEYAHAAYEATINETPCLEGESQEEKRRREISYLNLKWFMQTLLDRMDRTSMYTGLEARVPLADHRIVEYVWNVPWKMKCPHGIVKGLLREAGKDYLPQEIYSRRKSPYPKTYDPSYESMVKRELLQILHDPNAPLRELIDVSKTEQYLRQPSEYGRPFYGQLMAGPQFVAYLIQINYWLKHYQIQLAF